MEFMKNGIFTVRLTAREGAEGGDGGAGKSEERKKKKILEESHRL